MAIAVNGDLYGSVTDMISCVVLVCAVFTFALPARDPAAVEAVRLLKSVKRVIADLAVRPLATPVTADPRARVIHPPYELLRRRKLSLFDEVRTTRRPSAAVVRAAELSLDAPPVTAAASSGDQGKLGFQGPVPSASAGADAAAKDGVAVRNVRIRRAWDRRAPAADRGGQNSSQPRGGGRIVWGTNAGDAARDSAVCEAVAPADQAALNGYRATACDASGARAAATDVDSDLQHVAVGGSPPITGRSRGREVGDTPNDARRGCVTYQRSKVDVGGSRVTSAAHVCRDHCHNGPSQADGGGRG